MNCVRRSAPSFAPSCAVPQDAPAGGAYYKFNGANMEKESSSKGLTIGLSLLFGLAMASVRNDIEGFFIGALLGGLFAQILFLRKRTQTLSEQLRALRTQRLETRDSRLGEEGSAEPSRAGPPGRTTDRRTAAAPPSGVTPSPEPPISTSAAAGAGAHIADEREWTPPPRTPREPSAFDLATAQIIARLKRANPLALIGIVILFIGAAFLAKYAAERNVFPIELRFITVALVAFALLFVGWRLRDARPVYARLLQGGGVAGLYLTVFAATKLYQMLPIGLAFGLMVLIALAAAVIAVAQNALSLAVIGTAGGFLAPILVSTGGGDHVALFSYYAILNLGVFAAAWFKTWRVLNMLGFLFTFTITGLWRASGYEPADLYSAEFFLILFFLMYVGVSVLNSVRQPPNLKGYVSGSLVFGLPVVAFTLHATLVSHVEYALAWSAFALGAFYLALGWALFRTRRDTFHLLVEAFAALGVIFGSLAIPLAFDTRTTAAMWAVEGAGLLWLGVRQQRKLARAFGALLQFGAGLAYLAGLPALRGDLAVLNGMYLGALMLGASGVFSGYWLYRNRDGQATYEAMGEYGFTLWGLSWWLFAGLNEIAQFSRDYMLAASLAFAAVTAAAFARLAANREWPLPRIIAVYLPPLAAITGLLYASSLEHPFAQWGAVGWVLVLAAHFGLLHITDSAEIAGRAWLHAGACWLAALLAAWESSWQIAERTAGVWASLPWGLAPALLVAWLGRRTLTPEWPLARYATAYRVLGATPLVIATGCWIAGVNMLSRGDASWLPYVPLLNPLDVSVALSFAAGGLWWTSLDDAQRRSLWGSNPLILLALVAGLVFLWLNAALIRSLHHNWGAPITAYGVAHSTLVQSALSIFWGVLGFTAMTIAAKRRWRYVWLAGAGLMAIVVAKLFLVDLSNVGTIARITSFLSVGALLLITGYLAPLPPRRTLEHANT
jgi:uncharacterized membrane protein